MSLYAIDNPGLLYGSIVVAAVAIIVFVIAKLVTKHFAEKRKKECFNLLTSVCNEKNEKEFKIEYSNDSAYDYYIESEKHKYFIKLINNPTKDEICVNNAIKWQLRSGVKEKEIRFVEGVESLMRMDIKKDEKQVHKLFIIYPNAKALLKVINECEMVFVNPNTDIYGANIITFNQLEQDHELINL